MLKWRLRLLKVRNPWSKQLCTYTSMSQSRDIKTSLFFIQLAASSGKRQALVWRDWCPSVRLSHLFSNLNRARGAHSTWLTKVQHAECYEYGHTDLLS